MISNSNLSICFYHTEYMVLQTAAHKTPQFYQLPAL